MFSIFSCTIAENYLNKNNKDSSFDYYEAFITAWIYWF